MTANEIYKLHGIEQNDEQNKEDKIMETMNELHEYCENIREELQAIYDGTTTERNDDDIFTTFRDAYKNAMETLDKMTADDDDKTLYYAIRDTVKDRYPYI